MEKPKTQSPVFFGEGYYNKESIESIVLSNPTQLTSSTMHLLSLSDKTFNLPNLRFSKSQMTSKEIRFRAQQHAQLHM